jgi:hypothetical protein
VKKKDSFPFFSCFNRYLFFVFQIYNFVLVFNSYMPSLDLTVAPFLFLLLASNLVLPLFFLSDTLNAT